MKRFPIAGLPRDQRPAYWRGDFSEIREGGLPHAAWDVFVVDKPRATSRRYAGAAIVSTVDGVVPLRVSRTGTAGAGTSERGGHFVWIDDGEGNLHYFAHMRDVPKVRPGERVVAGQLIGYLGDSGNARGRPHLHFSVRRSSGAVDVYDQLQAVEQSAWVEPLSAVDWRRIVKVAIGASAAAGLALIAVYYWWPRRGMNRKRINAGGKAKVILGLTLENVLSDPAWAARHYGVADISGVTIRERAEDLAYQLGWEEGRSGREHSGVKGLLAWAKKQRWAEVLRAYEDGKAA